jgi:hypothetical protein
VSECYQRRRSCGWLRRCRGTTRRRSVAAGEHRRSEEPCRAPGYPRQRMTVAAAVADERRSLLGEVEKEAVD